MIPPVRDRSGRQRGLLATICLLTASAASGQTPPDWRFFGDTGDGEVSVFSAADIRKLPDGHLEVWTKGLSGKRVAHEGRLVVKDKERMNRVVWNLVTSPILNVVKLDQDHRSEVAMEEEIANHSDLKPVARILWDVDCSNRIMRTLSMYIVENGKTMYSITPGNWMHVAPESSGEMLYTLVCKDH